VIGWSMDSRMCRELVINALKMALLNRKPTPGLIHHSDRGSQYASHDYQYHLSEYQIRPSMSGKGDCYDNAVQESFFKTLKTELVYHCDYQTRDEAKKSVFEYIDVFYNRQRRHSFIGYVSPAEFEALNVA
ncbi:MAG: IS3 family transposase, partial [Nitrospinae bacterium]|nr:IS3 family transposase [Nitrospinota bacterium]